MNERKSSLLTKKDGSEVQEASSSAADASSHQNKKLAMLTMDQTYQEADSNQSIV